MVDQPAEVERVPVSAWSSSSIPNAKSPTRSWHEVISSSVQPASARSAQGTMALSVQSATSTSSGSGA